MYILGISGYFHDSAACLLKNGIPIAAAEEERFTRVKHDNGFPFNAIRYCLREAGISIEDVESVVFYDKPLRKFDRILQTCVETYPWSFWFFYEAIPEWLTQKLRVPATLKNELGYEGEVLFVEHHKSHAASAFLVSPFEEAAIVTVDAVGEWTSTAIHHGVGGKITTLKEINFPHSLGLFYSTITAYLGQKVLNDEYKIMALAAYGRPVYRSQFGQLIDVKGDGSFRLNMRYFAYTHQTRMFSDELEAVLGPRRESWKAKITQRHKDVAATLQQLTEETMLKITNYAHKLTGCENLCLAGGVALNCKANKWILERGPFKRIFIQPAATDAGGALGAAVYVWNSVLGEPRRYVMKNVYLGPSFTDKEIEAFLLENDLAYEKLARRELVKKAAALLTQGKTVGWFQGRLEFGPRALGSRSILADPTSKEAKKGVQKIKLREWYRPFAPTILAKRVKAYLKVPEEKEPFFKDSPSPFMNLTFDVRKAKEKSLTSVMHVDGTTRPQTLKGGTNRLYFELIEEFERLRGTPVVLNTSLNRKGEPIVCTPQEAYRDFISTSMDCLVLGRYLLSKDVGDEVIR
jgi:carbamoyltransferase